MSKEKTISVCTILKKKLKVCNVVIVQNVLGLGCLKNKAPE